MSQYLILIYEREAEYAGGDTGTWSRMREEHSSYGRMLGERFLGGNALQPSETATSIRSDGAGGLTVTDGPFAETKEVLGGYYLVEAESLDEAIELGKACPARFGGVEIRPVRVLS